MKFELEVVKFNVADVITASGCPQEGCPTHDCPIEGNCTSDAD